MDVERVLLADALQRNDEAMAAAAERGHRQAAGFVLKGLGDFLEFMALADPAVLRTVAGMLFDAAKALAPESEFLARSFDADSPKGEST